MPSYFNPHALSVDQQGLWDWAMKEYRRVQDQNIDRQIANMSDYQKQFLVDDERARHPGRTADVREILRSWSSMMGGGAGNGKSALFARLLSGKPALPWMPGMSANSASCSRKASRFHFERSRESWASSTLQPNEAVTHTTTGIITGQNPSHHLVVMCGNSTKYRIT